MSFEDIRQERNVKASITTTGSGGSVFAETSFIDNTKTLPKRKTTGGRNTNSIRVGENDKQQCDSRQQHFILSSKRHDRVSNSYTMAAVPHNGSSTVSGSMGVVSIGTKPTLIEKHPMRFLIMDAPRQSNLHLYIKEMRKNYVTEVVRVCEPTYRGEELSNAGIGLHEMEYKDGTSPSKELIMSWLQLVEKTFYQGGSSMTGQGGQGGHQSVGGSSSSPPEAGTNTIAVHCVAGLGRAPVMVAIALIEFGGMDPVEAVMLIRNKRRGAINEKQLLYLEGYKRHYKRAGGGGSESSCCIIL